MKPKPILFVLPAAAIATVLAQGPLSPPAGPAPAMKTLEQIEPRTPINNVTAPGDANYQHLITTAGSYYLTGNLDVTLPHGIGVRAAGVTIDLNGFEIRRLAGSGGHGIEVDQTAHRCTARNGSLRNFAWGLRCMMTADSPRGGRCIELSASGCTMYGFHGGEGWLFDGCMAHDNAGVGIEASAGATLINCTAVRNSESNGGIFAGANSTLINCNALDNTTTYGISAGNASVLTNCSAMDNNGPSGSGILTGDACTLTNCSAFRQTALQGIRVGNGCALTNCVARLNTAVSSNSGGIDAGSGCTLIGCAATGNTNTFANPSPVTGFGIRVAAGSTVRDCAIHTNRGDGIHVTGGRCHLAGNTCTDNAVLASVQGANIHLVAGSDGCRIEANHCTGAYRGFFIESSDNLIVRNSSRGTAFVAYSIVAGNHDAARVTSPGASFASTSPWANFSF